MFSHIMLGCDDLESAGRFYDAILHPLGLARRVVDPDGGPPSLCWVDPEQFLPRLYVTQPFDERPAFAGNGAMIAFLAGSPRAVDEAFAAGIAAGGRDDGKPGERPHYGQGYYGAYLRDPGGNKVHLAYRGDIAALGAFE